MDSRAEGRVPAPRPERQARTTPQRATRPAREATPREDARRPQRDARPQARGRASDPRRKSYDRRMRALVAGVVAVCALFLAYVVCVWSPLFQIRSIVVSPTTHVTDAQVSDLAAIPAGSTLFGFDESGVEKRLLSSPWIESVSLTRELPNTLNVEVREREVAAVVMLSNGTAAWRLSDDGVWIEPVELSLVTADNGVEAYDVQAKNAAAAEGVVYVSEVAATLNPQAGEKCTDEGLLGLLEYIDGFTPALLDQVVSACATSKESIAVVLSCGIKVSLGAPDDISLKEETVLGILDKFQGQISYINVRVPASPTYRGLTEGAASQGTDGSSVDSLPYQSQDGAADQAASQDGTAQDGADGTSQDAAQAGTDGSVATSATDVPDDAAYNGGYYLPDGQTWVNYYYGSDGSLVHGYYDADDNWVDLG